GVMFRRGVNSSGRCNSIQISPPTREGSRPHFPAGRAGSRQMAMKQSENELLTRIGPGTRMGNLMRRYWWPVGFTEQVTDGPVPVRILGEALVLFRNTKGKLGLLGRYCAHRRASLELGRVEQDGIRCCYHGWLYDMTGQCREMPAEEPNCPLIKEVKVEAYKVDELGGLIFAYLGPEPAPLLPR